MKSHREGGPLYAEPPDPWTIGAEDDWRERERTPRVPVSVAWCATGARQLVVWHRDGTGEVDTRAFRCKSWRCPRCRGHVGLIDYARCAQALAGGHRWLYCVLTLPAEARKRPIWERYRDAGKRWDQALRKRLQRRYGRIQYLQTWEQHRDGTPHLNVVLGGDALLDEVASLGAGAPRWNARARRAVAVPRWRKWWRSSAVACGFGRVTWVEQLWSPESGRAKPAEGLAAYMVKLAHNLGVEGAEQIQNPLDRKAGELTRADVKDQTPLSAPRGFRRLRASQGLLPPRWGPGELTGALRPSEEGSWDWPRVRRWQEQRESAISKAFDELERCAAQGLPLPDQVRKIVAREHRKQAAQT